MEMEKTFDHKKIEQEIYRMWESGGYFRAERDAHKKPYTIVLPPPNASGKMHTGNVLMIAIEDLLIRWKRMQGYSALWLPGTDHAGFETQTTFERKLAKENKSRFDFDRQTLYQKIWDFVQENKSDIEEQIRKMGASVDWGRYTFTLDDDVINLVYDTFEKMHGEGLVYRDHYIVNYSFKWGTTFSDAEIVYKEQKDPLYYMKYGPFTLATVRPETKFGDTAIAVHPDDDRFKEYVGKEIEVEGLNGPFKIQVIADKYVDREFGTGVVKITPAHDKNDFEVGRRHDLEVRSVIGLDGKLNHYAGKYEGLDIFEARKRVVEDLKEHGWIEKIDEDYTHVVPVDYRSGDYIENLMLPNWFIKVDDLKKPAYDVVKKGNLNIYPKWREVTYMQWVENMHDWAISRQVVWGIRIPVWYDMGENPKMKVNFLAGAGEVISGEVGELLEKYKFEEIEAGLQTLTAPKDAKYMVSRQKPDGQYLQETDTFDTWFSSGQWPLATLKYPDSEDFKYFYPTDVLETGWEIVTRWVSRMVMFGIYLTGKPPFKDIYLHGLVRALDGKKMSKSLGNVINPEDYMEEYGADALRMGLISGTANGKDFNFPRDKVISYRNFANKIWNMARFMLMMFEDAGDVPFYSHDLADRLNDEDEKILEGLADTINNVNFALERYRFADSGEALYHFMWDELAAKYLEHVKNREDKDVALSVFRHVFENCLKLLHPFMPFVTEEIWSKLPHESDEPLIVSEWPQI
jgi:valyl-tRNA synthetase